MTESFARRAWADTRNLKRSYESLLGISAGLMADAELNDTEIRYLDIWLSDNKALASAWPGEVIYSRVRTILADNKITEDEREHLKQTLSDLIGGTLQETGAAFGASTSLPIDNLGIIEIKGKTFCFTGNFRYGTRKACEQVISKKGGTAIPRVRRDLNYLVIGTRSSRDWIHTSYGRKIKEAIELKKNKCPIFIVSEKQWAESLSLIY